MKKFMRRLWVLLKINFKEFKKLNVECYLLNIRNAGGVCGEEFKKKCDDLRRLEEKIFSLHCKLNKL